MTRAAKAIAFAIALSIFISQKRMGMAIVVFLLACLLLKEKTLTNIKMIIYSIFAIVLFFLGYKLSLYVALAYVGPSGNFAWTFIGGFLGGVIELEAYLLLTLFPTKLMLCKNITSSVKYMLKVMASYFMVGGIIQGSYMAGWQSIFHI